MDTATTATPDRTETAARDVLVCAVADLRRVPLAEVIARRAARPAGKTFETDAGEFNSSI